MSIPSSSLLQRLSGSSLVHSWSSLVSLFKALSTPTSTVSALQQVLCHLQGNQQAEPLRCPRKNITVATKSRCFTSRKLVNPTPFHEFFFECKRMLFSDLLATLKRTKDFFKYGFQTKCRESESWVPRNSPTTGRKPPSSTSSSFPGHGRPEEHVPGLGALSCWEVSGDVFGGRKWVVLLGFWRYSDLNNPEHILFVEVFLQKFRF